MANASDIEQPLPWGTRTELDIAFDATPWLAKVNDELASYTLRPGPGLVKFSDSRAGAVVTTWVKLDSAVPIPEIGTILRVECDLVTASVPPRKETMVYLLQITH